MLPTSVPYRCNNSPCLVQEGQILRHDRHRFLISAPIGKELKSGPHRKSEQPTLSLKQDSEHSKDVRQKVECEALGYVDSVGCTVRKGLQPHHGGLRSEIHCRWT